MRLSTIARIALTKDAPFFLFNWRRSGQVAESLGNATDKIQGFVTFKVVRAWPLESLITE